MQQGIRITQLTRDGDAVELRIDVSDGTSFFSHKVYVDYLALGGLVSDLVVFREQLHGGLLDIAFGAFGPEYAYGAFHARLHFVQPGIIYMTCRMESDYQKFARKEVAGKATLYLKTEPVLLDNFIAELKSFNARMCDDAYLQAI